MKRGLMGLGGEWWQVAGSQSVAFGAVQMWREEPKEAGSSGALGSEFVFSKSAGGHTEVCMCLSGKGKGVGEPPHRKTR